MLLASLYGDDYVIRAFAARPLSSRPRAGSSDGKTFLPLDSLGGLQLAMKQFIYSVFVAFVASSATIALLAGLSDPPKDLAADKPRLVSAQELARHSTAADCWMAIEATSMT